MPTTPVYQLPYPAPADPADVPADMQELCDRLEALFPTLGGGALSATPPASPTDGQLWRMAPVAGLVWTFRYNAGSGSAFKWEFVGGAPLHNNVDPGFSSPGDSVYRDCGGPSVTCPRAGDYLLDHGFSTFNAGSVAWGAYMTIKLGAAAAADAMALVAAGPSAGGSGFIMAPQRRRLLTGRAAGDVLAAWGKAAGTTLNIENRWFSLLPVRVS